jgi:hypothetical protein
VALGLVLIMGHGGVKVSGRRKRGTVLPVVEKRESKVGRRVRRNSNI